MAIPIKCPLCSSSHENQFVVTPHVFGDETKKSSFFSCSNCEVIYQYPILNEDEMNKFYESSFESFMTRRAGQSVGWEKSEKHLSSNKKTYQRRYEILKEFLPKPSNNINILELGCSSGFMLFPLNEIGYNCFGVEPSGLFSDFVKRKGVNVFNSFSELIKKVDIKFDIIMHYFVLEHIIDPEKFIIDQLKTLKKGGKIVFEIPCSQDALFRIYDFPKFERFYWSKVHPWYFNEKSLRYLLDNLNLSYKIIPEQRYDLSNHMTWAFEGKPGGMNKYTHLLGEEIEEGYKKNLIKKGFYDTIFCVISK